MPARADDGAPASPTLREVDYEKIVERVYFSVATQIYRQIRRDVQRKISLLPTRYLRATAYFHEAEDYARSNTLDALDAARDLYESAIRMYDPRRRPRPRSRWRRPYLVFLQGKALVVTPLRLWGAKVWPRLARGEVMTARAEIGYADTLLYRRTLAGLSGHRMNSVYEARPIALRAIERLDDVPNDVPDQRRARFDAHVSLALACYQLELSRAASESLATARSLLPTSYDEDARYLYVAGVLEPRARFAIRLLRQAVERDPRFEVAQFELGLRTEMMWRTRPTLERSVAKIIQDEYQLVLKLNPGNLRAWENIAYIHWLLGDLEQAQAFYDRGREFKQVKRDAAVANLEYGLARVAAEQGRCDTAYRHFLSATSAQLVQGVSDTRWTSAQYYLFDFISEPIMRRYEHYAAQANANLASARAPEGESCDERVRRIVRAFVLNDYGEACHTYSIRNHSQPKLAEAKNSYHQPKELNPDAILPHYNLYLLRQYEGNTGAAIDELRFLRKLEPKWPDGILALVAAYVETANVEASTRQVAGNGTGGRDHVKRSFEDKAKRATEGRQAVERIRSLILHEWPWEAEDSEVPSFDWRAAYRADYARALRWERELDDKHVRALFLWVLGHLLLENDDDRRPPVSVRLRHPVRWGRHELEAEARAFLRCIRSHFWPGNFSVLLASYQLERRPETLEEIRQTIDWWLSTDPTAYWALALVTTDFCDWSGGPLELVSAEARRHYLAAALAELAQNSGMRAWIEDKLAALDGQEAAAAS